MDSPSMYVNLTKRVVAVMTRRGTVSELPEDWTIMVGDPIAERDWALENLVQVCSTVEEVSRRRFGVRREVAAIARCYRGEAALMQRTVGLAPGVSVCPICGRPSGSGHLGTCPKSMMHGG